MQNVKEEFNRWFNDLLLTSPEGPARDALRTYETALYVEWLRNSKDRQ